MKSKIILGLVGLSITSFAFSEEVKGDHQPKCKDEYSYAYHIYQEAMRSAKEGKCARSFKQFKETEKQWKYISTAKHCSLQEREDAESNVSRVGYDIGILKKKYCPNVGS